MNIEFDAVILTDHRYVNPDRGEPYIENLLKEDGMLMEALEERGLKTGRKSWDDPDFDWSHARYIVFRSTWDYFERGPEFLVWLDQTARKTSMVNTYKTIRWNMDKHYLLDLQNNGVHIPGSRFIETGDERSLRYHVEQSGWTDLILKPAVSGAARHTYRLNKDTVPGHEAIFRDLTRSESMMLQEFQHSVLSEGEVAHMLFGGRYSHSILKRAKQGDFRVQDDFGGTVHKYRACEDEIAFAEKALACCDPVPVYGRVDVIMDNEGRQSVSELELIEPELWMRYHPVAAGLFADAFMQHMHRKENH